MRNETSDDSYGNSVMLEITRKEEQMLELPRPCGNAFVTGIVPPSSREKRPRLLSRTHRAKSLRQNKVLREIATFLLTLFCFHGRTPLEQAILSSTARTCSLSLVLFHEKPAFRVATFYPISIIRSSSYSYELYFCHKSIFMIHLSNQYDTHRGDGPSNASPYHLDADVVKFLSRHHRLIPSLSFHSFHQRCRLAQTQSRSAQK